MDPSINFYQLLHVQPNAPAAVIKASYRTMMQKLKHHPDLGGDEATAQRLNKAVATLCNPEKRRLYDLEQTLQHRPAYPTQPSTRPESPQPDSTRARSRPDQHRSKYSTGGFKKSSPEGPVVKLCTLQGKSQCAFCHALHPQTSKHSQPYGGSSCAQCGGATTPVFQLDKSTGSELRKIHRQDHTARVAIWLEWPLQKQLVANLSDLSLTGCAIVSQSPLLVGNVVLLDSDALNAVCVVRYCKAGVLGSNRGCDLSQHQKHNQRSAYNIGIEFLTLNVKAEPGSVFSMTA